MLAGALVQGEKWLGRAVRGAYVQQGRYVLPPDITPETEGPGQLATHCARYECNRRQFYHHRPHIRPFRRDGDSIVGSGGLVLVSTDATYIIQIVRCVAD